MKPLFKLVFLAALLASLWFLLSRIDFTSRIDFRKISKSNERKIGRILFDFIKMNDREIVSDSARAALVEIKKRLCRSSRIDPGTIRIYLLKNSQVNALTLPDRQMIVYTGLIAYCRSPEELSGVMAHEIAHMEQRHVMNRMTREVGLSLLISMAGGQAGGELIREIAKTITSTAFDRAEEAEADALAVGYLANADIDPEFFANFLYRILKEESEMHDKLNWISTHPDTRSRVADILALKNKKQIKTRPVLSGEQWSALQKACRAAD